MSSSPAFEAAVSSQRRLEQALTGAGFDPDADFPLMNADVDPLGDPRIHLGPVTTGTADRLSVAIGAGPSAAVDCQSCRAWIDRTVAEGAAAHEPAERHCPDCWRTVVVIDKRGKAMPESRRQLARDAERRIGEVMGPPFPGSTVVNLRPVGGGLEWDAPADEIEYVDDETASRSVRTSDSADNTDTECNDA